MTQLTKYSLGFLLLASLLFASSLGAFNVRASNGGELIWAQTENPTPGRDMAASVVADTTGIYVGGYSASSAMIEKRSLIDGSIIWRTDLGALYPAGLALDNSGAYLAGLFGIGPAGSRIEKRGLSDGSLLWNQTTISPEHYHPIITRPVIAIDPTGVYVVSTEVVLGCQEWKLEKRQPSDGSLMWNFVSAPSPPYCSHVVSAVAVDASGVYVVSMEDSQGGAVIEKRSLGDGSLIWTQVERQVLYPATTIAVTNGAVYILMGNTIERRSAQDGSLAWTQPVGKSVESVVADSSGVYSAGCDYVSGRGEWYVEQRDPRDGSLIWAVSESPSQIYDSALGTAVDSSGLYVVGWEHNPNFPGLDDSWWRIEKRGTGSPATTVTKTSTQVPTTTTATIAELQVQIVSNSLVSSLIFDSTRSLLNFTVSGPDGSQGFFEATIAKSLLSGQPIVMIDGVEHPASVTEDANFWYIHVTYSHSQHSVTIGGSDTIPEFLSVAVLLAVLMLVILGIRRRHKLVFV
jgi:hypothetical protein